jgi:hypothetical protein
VRRDDRAHLVRVYELHASKSSSGRTSASDNA